jgi:hypothetical protein
MYFSFGNVEMKKNYKFFSLKLPPLDIHFTYEREFHIIDLSFGMVVPYVVIKEFSTEKYLIKFEDDSNIFHAFVDIEDRLLEIKFMYSKRLGPCFNGRSFELM